MTDREDWDVYTESEVMGLMNNVDDDWIDQQIDDLFNQKGESINMDNIRDKAMGKLRKKNVVRRGVMIAVAAAATLTISAVYASEISSALQSFFNKSVVYSGVVDGDAYVLPEALTLDDKLTLLTASVSKGHLEMSVDYALPDDRVSQLGITVVPLNDPAVCYVPGGYGQDGSTLELLFYNETEQNYNIAPFKDFTLTFAGKSYTVSLEKAESVKVDDGLVLGVAEAEEPANEDEVTAVETPLIARVAAALKDDGSIQLVTSFDDPDLRLRGLGEPTVAEYRRSFENDGDSIVSSGHSSGLEALYAYDSNNNAIPLEPKEGTGRPVSEFTVAAAPDSLRVVVPAIEVHYEKQVESFVLPIPADGEQSLNQELDFIIQKALVQSVVRTSPTTAVVTLALNTGADRAVSINDISADSRDVSRCETVIRGDTAVMTMTFDEGIEEAAFTFTWPSYVIRGGWTIDLGTIK